MHSLKHRYRGLVCQIIPLVFLVNLIAGISHAATHDEVEKVRKLDSHEKLIAILEKSNDMGIRKIAGERLSGHWPRNKAEFDVLVDAVLRDSDASDAAVTALTGGAKSDPERKLLKQYRKLLKDSNLRLKAVGILYAGQVKDKKSFSKICRLLKDRQLGHVASRSLGLMGDPRAIPYIIGIGSEWALVALNDLGPGVAKALVEEIEKIPEDSKSQEERKGNLLGALSIIENPAEKEYLLSQTDHKREDIRTAVWSSLAWLRDESLMEMFREAALSGDEVKAHAAIDGLAKGGEKGLEILQMLLEEEPELAPRLRRTSIINFGYFGSKSHIPALQKIAEEDRDKENRRYASRAIALINQRAAEEESKIGERDDRKRLLKEWEEMKYAE